LAALVTVAGRFEYPNNAPAGPGTITWTLLPGNVPDTTEPVTIIAGPISCPIGSDGTFTINLRATDDADLTPHVDGELVYRVVRTLNSITESWDVEVPTAGAPHDWVDLEFGPAIGSLAIVVDGGPL
jgi:hypothetical protein